MQRFFAVFLAVFLSSVGEARWATLDDAPTVIESIRERYEVHADGTFELESETVESVRNEVGRAQGVNFAAPFSPTLAKVEVLEAKTISPAGVETNVPSNLIESRRIPSVKNVALKIDNHRVDQLRLIEPKKIPQLFDMNFKLRVKFDGKPAPSPERALQQIRS